MCNPDESDPNILPSKQFVSSNFEDLYLFCKENLNYNGVIKSLYGYGGEDVFLIEKKNLKNTLRALLKKGPVLAQDYIQNEGDKRILLLNGEPIGWYKRLAPVGETLHNIHLGGRPFACDLSENDRKIIKLLRPILVKYGMVFVGIDILGNVLSEINSEVPGGTVRVDKLGGFQSRERIIQYLEKKVIKK